jgi:crossover junction endodeoxyribonuclease RusA
MVVFQREIDTNPIAKGSMRPITSKTTGRVFLMHDQRKALREFTERVQWELKAAMNGRAILRGAVKVEAIFERAKPKKAAAEKCGWMTTAPDIDKLGRALLDAMTGVVFADDRQVVALAMEKRWGDSGRVIVRVTDLGG